jgi:hypothetical protein
MKQVASKGRILLRKILTGLSLGAVAVTFQACYGMDGIPDNPPTSLRGTVKSSGSEDTIPGIHVSNSDDYFTLTGSNGEYRLYVADQAQTVWFRDIDGPDNGEFQDKEVIWNPGDSWRLDVSLDPK